MTAPTFDDARIDAIVDEVVRRLAPQIAEKTAHRIVKAVAHPPAPVPPAVLASPRRAPVGTASRRPGVFGDVDSAVAAARRAFEQFEPMPLETRKKILVAMRSVALDHVEQIASMAHEETGLGRVEDKVKKNTVAITKTPGMEILEPIAYSGDDGLSVTERAPFGVLCSITPSTNPTETIINNGIGMVAGGNAVVYNVHPGARGVSAWFVALLNDAIVGAGGPQNLLCCIAEPSIESAQALMKHPGIRLVVVTGGGAVVQAAMTSGKRAIAAGPGNPPVVVDETADVMRAAKGIIAGASFDNNVICTDEKEIIAVADVADRLKAEMKRQGAYELSSSQLAKLEKTILDAEGHVVRDFIGKNAAVLLRAIGGSGGDELRLLFGEVDEKHPFVQTELLMPVVGFVRAPDADEAIAMAKRVEHGFGHTAVMYSTHIENLHKMARAINTSIFVKNAPNFAGIGYGGEGYTSWTIASPTGEGLTTARTFTRERRCTLKDYFRFV